MWHETPPEHDPKARCPVLQEARQYKDGNELSCPGKTEANHIVARKALYMGLKKGYEGVTGILHPAQQSPA